MTSPASINLDAAIFGGGVAGLWLLDELVRRGYSVLLLEAHQLGAGQTIASQGIIHGGLKYTLDGLLHRSAAAIRDMPQVWRDCLAGRREPKLTATRVRAHHCHLWRTDDLSSKLAMIGARVGLQVKPRAVELAERPAVLEGCPGTVARLDEQVIDPASLLSDLAARNHTRILKVEGERGLRVGSSEVQPTIEILGRAGWLRLRPDFLILAAGQGNEKLRAQFSLPTPGAMQRRPLHMAVLRAETHALPELCGHCVDGSRTRVTITSDVDALGRRIWQVGGQIAEDGVSMQPRELVDHARAEVQACLPGLDLSTAEWATYRVDRAEGSHAGGGRPDDVCVLAEGDERSGSRTIWPTKMALVPRLVDRVVESLPRPRHEPKIPAAVAAWERPTVALPPWEEATQWFTAS